MGYAKLELLLPMKAAMITSVDPDPLWTLDDLLSELNSLELQLGARDHFSSPLKKYERFSEVKETRGSDKPFVMCILEDDAEESGSGDGFTNHGLTTGTRFTCDVFYVSESEGSDDELHMEPTSPLLMEKKSIEEGILFELENKHHLIVKEQLRSKLSALELSQKNENEKSSFSMHQLEKQAEARREMDRRLDKQYQRRIAEVLDNRLSILQRNHEQRSQIEERRIRDDAVLEEAKRKEKAMIEERLCQEKAKTEAEAKLNAIKQAEVHKAALEAENRAAAEAAEKEIARIRETTALDASKKESTKSKGIKVFASETALKAESNRLTIYNEAAGNLNAIALKDIDRLGRQMKKKVNQAGGSVENVRTKARELVQLIDDPVLPISISSMIFANKVLSLCENPSLGFDTTAFSCGWVILLVSSQVPSVIDFVIAEFHRTCIYTVPKHPKALDAASQTNEYWKMMGYREKDGKIESSKEFMERAECCMKLYAALIQTEIDGVRNPHGLREGWTWIAMLLNTLPANAATSMALEAFLRMAGYALFRRYKSQFIKVLNVISTRFLPTLKQKQGEARREVVMKLEQYLNDKVYMQEPEGRHLQGSSLSKVFW
ncbi:hypothetical protein KSP40_PGU000026 [Platanthera guangdongensis]|uniref:mRNA export factor GLE1 n=1 Tax=Platanthera guangdongensis TaxID=2320717 RepID=A0ABR2M6H4_9ASPA